MTGERIGPVAPDNGVPRICRAAVHDNLVYVCGVTPEPPGDVTVQTRQDLERIDQILAAAGTNKARIRSAQVWLADMRHFRQHRAAWNEWVEHNAPPGRACVEARLWQPKLLAEIMVIAARSAPCRQAQDTDEQNTPSAGRARRRRGPAYPSDQLS